MREYTYRAEVLRVVDGDTLLAQVELGFGVAIAARLRLRGMDAPPLDSPGGAEARDALASKYQGRKIWIRFYKMDRYGRALVDVLGYAA